jgi:hypothetical protein
MCVSVVVFVISNNCMCFYPMTASFFHYFMSSLWRQIWL